jgi:hypothetical protein
MKVRTARRSIAAAWIALAALAGSAGAQTLRFDEYRDIQVPDTANIRLGPFYSDLAFAQSVGYRYTRTTGPGAPVMFENRRGRIREDGSELPMVSTLSVRNYLLISRYMDLDVSFRMSYAYFPMDTEESEFTFEAAGLGLSARMGAFSFSLSEDTWLANYNGQRMTAYTGERASGFAGNVSMDFYPTPFVRGRLYDNPSYRVDYVDERGMTDWYGGTRYRMFQNIVGLDLDWLMAKDKNLAYSASRTDTIPQDDEFDNVSSVVWRQGLAYQQQINPLMMAGARADYTWRDFDEGRGGHFQQDYSVFTGVQLTESSSLQASLGQSRAELTDAGAYETNGVSESTIGSATLQTQLSDTLSHALRYSRSQRAGFDAGLEVVSAYQYVLNWNPGGFQVGLSTALEDVDTRLSNATDYQDWITQLAFTWPLMEFVTFHASTAYDVRRNDPPPPEALNADQPEIANDYTTWVSAVGLNFILTRHLNMTVYGERDERFGDAPEMESERYTTGVTLFYYYDL